MQFTKATRKKAKLRLALTGPSGSGKTYSALLLAKGLGGRIAVIDTEHDSASLYAGRAEMPEFEALNLAPLLGRKVTSLSGGERQRVALGRTVLSCPRLILLDEPLSGLDEGLKFQIIPHLKKVFGEFGIPLILISHSLNEMRLLSDQVLEFSAGALVGQTTAEELARRSLGTSRVGYINLLELRNPRQHDGLFIYGWGNQEIALSAGSDAPAAMFELSSKDITLFKRHPEATSARNMLHGRVRKLFGVGNRIGVELDCGGPTLVSQVVAEAVHDLGLEPGSEIYAVIKASAFRRLY